MKIVIAAASGNIGRRTAEKVIQSGAETVLLSRNPEKLADLVAKGAIVKPISSDDPQGLIEITQQADALFWLTPPKLDVPNMRDWYLHTATAGANAVRANGIARVVNISSIGAGAKSNLGTVSFSGDVESIQQQFAAMGATADVQQEMGDLFRALGDPDGVYATARTLDATTPTTFEQFVKKKLLPNLQ